MKMILKVLFSITILMLQQEVSGTTKIDPGLDNIRVTWENPHTPKEASVLLTVAKSDDLAKGVKVCRTNDTASMVGCVVHGLSAATMYTATLAFDNGDLTTLETVNIMTNGEAMCKDMEKELITIVILAVLIGILIIVVIVLLLCIICKPDKGKDTRKRKAAGRYPRPTSYREAEAMHPEPYSEIDGRTLYASTLSRPPDKPPPYSSRKMPSEHSRKESAKANLNANELWELEEREPVRNTNKRDGLKGSDAALFAGSTFGKDDAENDKKGAPAGKTSQWNEWENIGLDDVELYQTNHAYQHGLDLDNVEQL